MFYILHYRRTHVKLGIPDIVRARIPLPNNRSLQFLVVFIPIRYYKGSDGRQVKVAFA